MWCLIDFFSWNLIFRKLCTDPGYFGIYPCKISYMYARIRAVQSSSSYVAMNFMAGKKTLAGGFGLQRIGDYKTGGPRGFASGTLQSL